MPIIGNLSSAGKKPTTPTIGTATDGGTGTSANVAFTASSYIGKGTITYTALSNPGSITGTGSASPIAVSGLTTGTAYTFTVKGDTNYGVASDYSAASNSVTPASPTSYESIATTTVGVGGATTITFSSIPSTYTHLQIRCLTRSTEVATDDNIYIQLNGSGASSYAWHRLLGNGASASSGAGSTSTLGLISLTTGSTSGASMFGAAVIDILDYTNTNKNRTVRGFGGSDQNGSGYAAFQSTGYFNTTAVSSILLGTSLGFAQNSTFALYGIKG